MDRFIPLAESSVGCVRFSAPNPLPASRSCSRHSARCALSLCGLRPAPATRHPSPATGRRTAAFTLIELMVVVAIIAILAGLALSTLGYVNRKGAASRAQSEVAALSAAIESYKLEFGTYPASAATLYADLTGSGTLNTNKVFFEPPPGMVPTNTSAKTFTDPYGVAYVYKTNATRNIGLFDLYCVPPDAKTEADWIHN